MTPNVTPEPPKKNETRERRTLLWAAFLVPFVVLVVAIAVSVTRETTTLESGSSAPPFVLPATDGSMVSLDDVIAGGDALLFFSMGAGCSGCFAQIPEIDGRLADLGIRLVPIMVDPPSVIDPQVQRFGVETPILMDYDRTVSEAYNMLGIYGHADRPSHSFTLVDAEGRIKWTRHFAEMFVPFDILWAQLEDEAL